MLTEKGRTIKHEMKQHYGKKKGEQVFYASKNAGKIKGVERSDTGKRYSRRSVQKRKT